MRPCCAWSAESSRCPRSWRYDAPKVTCPPCWSPSSFLASAATCCCPPSTPTARAALGANLGRLLDRLAHIPTLRGGEFIDADLRIEPFRGPRRRAAGLGLRPSRRPDELGRRSAQRAVSTRRPSPGPARHRRPDLPGAQRLQPQERPGRPGVARGDRTAGLGVRAQRLAVHGSREPASVRARRRLHSRGPRQVRRPWTPTPTTTWISPGQPTCSRSSTWLPATTTRRAATRSPAPPVPCSGRSRRRGTCTRLRRRGGDDPLSNGCWEAQSSIIREGLSSDLVFGRLASGVVAVKPTRCGCGRRTTFEPCPRAPTRRKPPSPAWLLRATSDESAIPAYGGVALDHDDLVVLVEPDVDGAVGRGHLDLPGRPVLRVPLDRVRRTSVRGFEGCLRGEIGLPPGHVDVAVVVARCGGDAAGGDRGGHADSGCRQCSALPHVLSSSFGLPGTTVRARR